MNRTSVLFCCLGNICRSPTAEGVFRRLVEQRGLADVIQVDSVGTGDYHVGHPPDYRAVAAAKLRGYDLSALRARQVSAEDIVGFDYVLAMDHANLADLIAMSPTRQRGKPRLFMDFSRRYPGAAVPDPYNGRDNGFEIVLDMVEDGARGLLEHIRKA
jgi:protein-tyrosine phosphatase